MIKASEKTKKRLAKRLERFGVKYGKVFSEWMFTEPVKVCIPTTFGIRFLVSTEYPIQPMADGQHYASVIGTKVSRMARLSHLERISANARMSSKELEYKALEAAGEFTEFLNHIKNPRVQVV